MLRTRRSRRLFFFERNSGRQTDLLRKRHKYHVSSGNRDVRSQTGTLCRYGLLNNLDQNRLSGFKHIRNLPFLGQHRTQFQAGIDFFGTVFFLDNLLGKIVYGRKSIAQIKIMNERIFFMTYINKCSIQRRHDFPDLTQV